MTLRLISKISDFLVMIHIQHVNTFLLIVHLSYLDRKWLRYGGLMAVMAVMAVWLMWLNDLSVNFQNFRCWFLRHESHSSYQELSSDSSIVVFGPKMIEIWWFDGCDVVTAVWMMWLNDLTVFFGNFRFWLWIRIQHVKTFLLIVQLSYLDRKWLRYGGLMAVML